MNYLSQSTNQEKNNRIGHTHKFVFLKALPFPSLPKMLSNAPNQILFVNQNENEN
jgi:hypothetical protein